MTKVHQVIAENNIKTPFDISVENFYYNGTVKRDTVKISDITMLENIVEARGTSKEVWCKPFQGYSLLSILY